MLSYAVLKQCHFELSEKSWINDHTNIIKINHNGRNDPRT